MHWNVTENNFQPSQHIYKGIICTGNLKQTKKLLQISTLNLCTDGKMNAIMKLPNWTFAIFPYSKIKSWIALFITRACAQSALNRLWGSPWHFTLTVFECKSIDMIWMKFLINFNKSIYFNIKVWIYFNKGIGDAGSTADFRMLWSAMVCLGLL